MRAGGKTCRMGIHSGTGVCEWNGNEIGHRWQCRVRDRRGLPGMQKKETGAAGSRGRRRQSRAAKAGRGKGTAGGQIEGEANRLPQCSAGDVCRSRRTSARARTLRLSAAEAAVAAAAAQKQDNPDPVTAAVAGSMFTAASAAKTVAAAAAQDQDQPDHVASATSRRAFTSTVCCCQITHVCSSKYYLH